MARKGDRMDADSRRRKYDRPFRIPRTDGSGSLSFLLIPRVMLWIKSFMQMLD